jgi:hypothetical protein
VSIF